MNEPVYMDYNATAPLRPQAREAITAALAAVGNASSVHGFGRGQRARIEEARATIAALVGAAPAGVIFTGSGTEANNLALKGARRRRIIVSAGEHESVLAADRNAEHLALDGDGLVRPEELERRLSDDAGDTIVSVMLANNETGVVQPVAALAGIAHAAGALVHCDAVQAVGRLPVDMAELDVDLLSLSAHKLGGPQGVGALVVREGVELDAQTLGGGQESYRRAGTENAAGIAGFAAAAKAAVEDVGSWAALAALRDRMEAEALTMAPHARIFGVDAPRLANTSCLALPGLKAETQVMALDLAGVAVSAGSACSSGKVTASHVLRAMGADESLAGSAIRVSLGWASTPRDVDRFLAAWEPLARRAARAA
jgi:cysteine desulfurase